MPTRSPTPGERSFSRSRSGTSGPPHARPAGARPLVVVLANIGIFLVAVLLLELGARTLAPRDLRGVFNDPQVFIRKRPFVVAHPERGFALQPGYQQGEYRINRAGLRGAELPPDWQQRERIVAVGESSTFGWGVGDDATYPAQLQALLDAQPGSGPGAQPRLVLNAGVPSYTSAQTLLYLRELLPAYEPRVVIAGLLWNDALFACLPNWMPDYLVAQQPAPWRQFLLRHSGLYRALALDDPQSTATTTADFEAPIRTYGANLSDIATACRRAGADIWFLMPSVDPSRVPAEGMKIGSRVVPRDTFLALLARFRQELETVAARDNVPVVRHRLSQDGAPTQYFIDPVHLNAEGNRWLAEDIAERVSSAPGRVASKAGVP